MKFLHLLMYLVNFIFLQILLYLRYVGHNGFYHTIRDAAGPSTHTVGRVVRRVSEALFDLRHEFIKWPEQPENLAQNFYSIAGFPSIAGAIDGCHVLVIPPKQDELSFLNRHHTHSINVLCVAGPNREILYLNANQGGRCHDSRVLQNSSLWQLFEIQRQLPFPGAVLLGDSGYPLKPWLMTPYLGNLDESRRRFNASHSRTRCLVEQCFGILKQKFHCLRSGLRVKDMTLAGKIITSCAILHNLSILHGQNVEPELLPLGRALDQPENDVADARGEHRRTQILQHFQRV